MNKLNPLSALCLRTIQEVSRWAQPRGLPRCIWLSRRIFFGTGVKVVSFGHRFELFCAMNSYYELMATCGFVYRHLDRVLRAIVTPPAVFIDVGSNFGFVTLLACSSQGRRADISAHCFEPDPGVFEVLQRNLELNRVNIALHRCALAAEEGVAELTISARSGWSTLSVEPPGGFAFLPKAGKTIVDVTTLDSYCAARDIVPTVIKIDVEGYEAKVLDGGRWIISRTKPYIVLEINELRLLATGTSGRELMDKTSSLGYRLYHVDPRHIDRSSAKSRDRWLGLPRAMPQDITVGYDF